LIADEHSVNLVTTTCPACNLSGWADNITIATIHTTFSFFGFYNRLALWASIAELAGVFGHGIFILVLAMRADENGV